MSAIPDQASSGQSKELNDESSLLLAAVSLLAAPQWTVQTSGVSARLRGVSAVSNRVAWASGADSTVLRTTDGGTTWKKL